MFLKVTNLTVFRPCIENKLRLKQSLNVNIYNIEY